VSIQFGPEWADFENRLARYPQITETNLTRALTASLLMIEADAKRNVTQDTRRLAGSINHQIVGTYPNLVGRVGPSLTYGRFVEFGRRPGRMPPVDALMGWVRRHWNPAFIGPVQRGSLRPKRTASRNVTQNQIRSRAFALARHIALHGVRAQPFMQPAYRRNQRQIEQLFLRMGARIVAYLAGGPAV
jgi:Bacteriophage HK97-gp10, putative tail-component